MVKNKSNNIYQPKVSVCTPTFNRRPFIPSMIECFNHQIYPKNKIEWIIVDDGTDKIKDLVIGIPQVKYIELDERISLGKKRNIMHEHCTGDIIVYMDDDDYYPPTRISHAVTRLISEPKKMIAGCSEIYVYFKHIQSMWQFGPYKPNHATAGTFAFKRQLLENHRYDESKAFAEESSFLNNFTVPMIQLEPRHVILVFSHIHNTFDKKSLLEHKDERVSKKSDKTVDYFIEQKGLKDWFMNEIDIELNDYDPGLPKHKPDVLEQIEFRKKQRMEAHNKQSTQLMTTHQNQVVVNNNCQPKLLDCVTASRYISSLIERDHKLIEQKKELVQKIVLLEKQNNTVQNYIEYIFSLQKKLNDNNIQFHNNLDLIM